MPTCDQCGSTDLALTKRVVMSTAYRLSGGEISDQTGTDSIEWSATCATCNATQPEAIVEAATLIVPLDDRCYPDCDGKCGLGHRDLRR
jgi:hypothetical protein